MILETDRCIIRSLTMEDADDLYAVLSDAEVMKYIEPAFEPERTRAFIREAGLCVPALVYAVVWRETGRVIGHAVFHPYTGNDYEIGWILNRKYWGLGIADELTKALIGRARKLNAISCVIECDPRQSASRRIALKNGFSYDGISDGLEVYRLKL